MSDKIWVFSYSTLDEKIHKFQITEKKLQLYAEEFPTEVFFVLTDIEAQEAFGDEPLPDNLGADFMYYVASIDGSSYWICTCNNFLETDAHGENRMLKRAIAHARKTGHTINPKGN